MIYSTCTYNTLEDEENVRWISQELGADILPCNPQPEWNVVGNLLDDTFPCCHFFPHRIQGEGFFCAILRKHGEQKPLTSNRSTLTTKYLRILPDPLTANRSTLIAIDVDHPTALRYLHGEALVLPPDVPKGEVIITYRGLPLGLAKNVGNRANNLYPKEWRTRKQVDS